jgi:uncharacterized protein YcbX
MHLAAITLYPIKSLDGVSVQSATIAPGGALAGDREFGLVDRASGKVMRAKEFPVLQTVRAQFEPAARGVVLSGAGQPDADFHLDNDRTALIAWFARCLDRDVDLLHWPANGLPDDPNIYGPTIVAEATMNRVGYWFDDMPLAEVQQRMRVNLMVAEAATFWEDALVEDDRGVSLIRIGDVIVHGIALCPRCAVPARDPQTGESTPAFVDTFRERRGNYSLCLRTFVDPEQAGKALAVGAPVAVVGRAANVAVTRRHRRFADRAAALQQNTGTTP